MKPSVLPLLACLCIPLLSRADTLAVLYREALASDPQYAVAKAQHAAVEERVPQAAAGLLPSVTLNANSTQNNNQNITDFSNIGQSYKSGGWTLNGTMPLFHRQNALSYDQSKQALAQARAQLDLAHQDLIIRLSQAYFDALLAGDSMHTIQAQRAATAEQLAAVKRKFEIGTSSITDVTDTQAKFDLVIAQEIAAANELEGKQQTLRVLVNREPGNLARLRAGFMPTPPNPNALQYWLDLAETTSQSVLAGQSALEVARLEGQKATAAHLPTLDIVATHGDSNSATTTTVGTRLRSATIGLQLSLPIFSAGATSAHEREMAAMLIKARAELDGARRTGSLTARQAFLGVKSGVAQAAALTQALESAKTALKSSQRGLELGVRVNIDVLNARQQMAATERDLAKTRYDSLIANLRLKAAAGTLGEVDVIELSGLLEGH